MTNIKDVRLAGYFLEFLMADLEVVSHKLGTNKIACSCQKDLGSRCEHINYLYSVLEKVPERSFVEILKLKSNDPEFILTGTQYEYLRGAVARAYNRANGVVKYPDTNPRGPLGKTADTVITDEWTFTSDRNISTAAVDPAAADFDSTAFRLITRYWGIGYPSPVVTSDRVELPVDGNIVVSRKPIEPKPEEPKEPPKPPSRFGDLEI
jgi:hypothetical protein